MAGDRMTSALNLLEANGYTNFTNFKSNGTGYTATVSQNGPQLHGSRQSG